MPSPAVQTPFHPTVAKREGRRLYRKQVVPVGTVTHPEHGDLEFTADVIRDMAETFEQGAMTQVPFVLCDEKNRHTDDPERFRGEVRSLEVADDGLYAHIEMTERGAALLEDNPTQPVSIRMLRPVAGKFAGRTVLGHVAATLDEVAKNMHPWERIDASSASEVTDLSDGAFTLPDAGHGSPAGDMAETDTPTLKPEDQGWIDKIRSAFKPDPEKGKADDPAKSEAKSDAEKAKDEQEADRVLAEVLGVKPGDATGEPKDPEPKAGEQPEKKADPEPVALSDDDRQAIDLAKADAAAARKDAADARADANRERFERESILMKQAGIPKAAVDLARPVLEHGLPEQIDLSNGEKVDAAKIIRGLLDQLKGTVDFSELGAAEADDDDVVADQRRKDAEAAAKGWV